MLVSSVLARREASKMMNAFENPVPKDMPKTTKMACFIVMLLYCSVIGKKSEMNEDTMRCDGPDASSEIESKKRFYTCQPGRRCVHGKVRKAMKWGELEKTYGRSL